MQNEPIKELNKNFDLILEKCPEIVFVGSPVLRQNTQETTLEEGLVITEKLKNILLTYRSIVGYGRGLAAPQIGLNKSVFVTYVNDEFQVYINPEITKRSDEYNLYREGCLSCGYMCADVKRAKSIVINYINENGKPETIEADGFLARLLQHEYDHLLGIVNIDIAETGTIEFMVNDPLKEQLRTYGK